MDDALSTAVLTPTPYQAMPVFGPETVVDFNTACQYVDNVRIAYSDSLSNAHMIRGTPAQEIVRINAELPERIEGLLDFLEGDPGHRFMCPESIYKAQLESIMRTFSFVPAVASRAEDLLDVFKDISKKGFMMETGWQTGHVDRKADNFEMSEDDFSDHGEVTMDDVDNDQNAQGLATQPSPIPQALDNINASGQVQHQLSREKKSPPRDHRYWGIGTIMYGAGKRENTNGGWCVAPECIASARPADVIGHNGNRPGA